MTARKTNIRICVLCGEKFVAKTFGKWCERCRNFMKKLKGRRSVFCIMN